MSGRRRARKQAGLPPGASPSPRTHQPSWLAVGIVALGVMLVVAVSLGALRNVAALTPAGTPAASPGVSGTPLASPVASPGASPVAGTTGGSGQAGNNQQASEAINSITQRIVSGNPILARAQDPTAGQLVFDPYGLLTTDEANSLTSDANRLKAAGLPTLVYARISLNTQAQSQQFAQTLVQKPGLVETSPGAQNGLIVLVSVPPGVPQRGNIVVAYGKNALPVNGLNATSIQEINESDMVPQLKQGQIFAALQLGLRRFNYVVAYTPYSYPHLSTTARTIGKWLSIVAPALGALAIALLVTTWFPAGAMWRAISGVGWRRWLAEWWPGVLAGAFCVILVPLSVYARDRIGIFVAAAVIFAMLLDVWVTAKRRRPRRTRRTVTVTRSVQARFAAHRRASGPRNRLERPGESGGVFE